MVDKRSRSDDLVVNHFPEGRQQNLKKGRKSRSIAGGGERKTRNDLTKDPGMMADIIWREKKIILKKKKKIS